jgi:hyperosmotically inducible protein
MSSHKANKTVALGGLAVAISIGAIAFFATSRHDAPATKAPTPSLAAAVAPAALPPPETVPASEDFVSNAGRDSAATPTPPAAIDRVAAPIASKAKTPERAPAAASNRVIIHDVPVSAPMRQVPEVASTQIPATNSQLLESAPDSARPDPIANAVANVGINDDAATDRRITEGVKSAIAADSQTASLNIGVTSLHGNVTLSGHLATQDAIDHAREVARTVSGVLSVDVSALVVASL